VKLDTDKVLVEVEDQIAWITFNHPSRHNALSLEMWQGLGQALEGFDADPNIRVAVMRGAGGKSFISGADISEFSEKRNSVAQKAEYGKVAGYAMHWLASFQKPLIAMIQGYCIGGGLMVATGADVRFATPDSKFGIPAAKLGLGYEYGGVAKLMALVGPATARDMLFSGRLFASDEAYDMRLINFIMEDEKLERKVREYASQVAANAPLTVRAAKAAALTVEQSPEKRDLARVNEMVDACFESEDYQEGQLAFREKRKPQFKGR
jgi:enoyl-CoA hydratase